MILHTFSYYLFFVSIILIYGIEIKDVLFISSPKKFMFSFLQLLFCATFGTLASFLVTKYILVPVHLAELLPITTLLIYLIFAITSSFIFYKVECKQLLKITFPIILISVAQANSILQGLQIELILCFAYLLFSLIAYTLKVRLKQTNPVKEFSGGNLIYISFAFVFIAFYGMYIS